MTKISKFEYPHFDHSYNLGTLLYNFRLYLEILPEKDTHQQQETYLFFILFIYLDLNVITHNNPTMLGFFVKNRPNAI